MAALKVLAKYNNRYYELIIDDILKQVQSEGRLGINNIFEGSGPLVDLADKISSNLSAFFALYLYSDGTIAAELAIYNDSITKPVGKVTISWGLLYNGKPVFSKTNVILADQCGDAVAFGKLKYASRSDYKIDWLPKSIPYTMLIPTGHIDPIPNTHQTSSPRNELYNPNIAMFVKSGNSIWLDKLHEFSLFQVARPYHLDNFDYKKKYSNKQPVTFKDGKIVVTSYPNQIEHFGRTHEAKFADLPQHPNGGAMNGGDPEHMTVDQLYHCYMALGSRLARRELLQTCNWLPAIPTFMQGDTKHPSSERVVGWCTKAWTLAADVTFGTSYFDMLEQLINQTVSNAKVDDNDTIPYLMYAAKPAADHIPDQKFSCVWQTGIAIHCLTKYLRIAEKYNKTASKAYENAKKLIVAGTRGILRFGYKGEIGCVNDYGIEWIANEPNAVPQWLGTKEWIIAGLADAVNSDFLPNEDKLLAVTAYQQGLAYWKQGNTLNQYPSKYFKSLIFADTKPL